MCFVLPQIENVQCFFINATANVILHVITIVDSLSVDIGWLF